MRDSRSILRQQLEVLFRRELADGRAERFAAVDALCAFEAYDLLRRDQGLSLRRTHEAITTALRALLDA
jgi:hypothetical protein